MVYIFSPFTIGNGKKNEDGMWERKKGVTFCHPVFEKRRYNSPKLGKAQRKPRLLLFFLSLIFLHFPPTFGFQTLCFKVFEGNHLAHISISFIISLSLVPS